MPQNAGDRAPSLLNPSVITRSSLVVSSLVVLALMSGWGIFLYLGIGSLIPSKPQPKPSPDDRISKPDTTMTGTESGTSEAEYREAERLFVLELQRDELHERLESTRASLELARNISHQFHARKEALQTSDTGRRLATLDAARKVKFLTAFPEQLDLDPFVSQMSQAERLMQSTDQPLSNFGQLVQQLIEIESKFDLHNRQYETAINGLDQLLNEYPVAQTITLEEATAQFESSDARTVPEQVAARIADEQSVLTSQMQTATDRVETLNLQLRQARKRLDAMSEDAQLALESSQRSLLTNEQELSDQKAQDVARMKQAYTAVRALLIPFTTPGFRQQAASGKLEVTSDKQPLSYAGLLRTGALEESDEGLEKLFRMAQTFDGYSKFNDRPQGAFPTLRDHQDIKKADVRAKLKRAQTFLLEHGEAMVEAGLLSP